MPAQPIVFEDFSGGIADKYVDTDIRRACRLDNLLIDEVKKPYVRDGSYVFPGVIPSSVNQRKPGSVFIGSKPFHHPLVITGKHALTLNESSTWTEVQGPLSNDFLPGKTDSIPDASLIWRRQLISCAGVTSLPPTLIYCSSLASPQTMKALTLGLPQFASAPTTAATGTAWSGAYAFFYKYTYTDFLGTIFEFFGNPLTMNVTNATGGPDAANIVFAAIPALANTTYTNYDTAVITKEIYRTVNGGQTYFFLASIPNATTAYTDSTADTTITSNAPIYTAGGALGYDQPPAAAIGVAQTYDFFWYASETTLYQSISGAPGACPADFADDLDERIRGLSDITSFPILFCDRSIYRVEGTFDSFGNGGFQRRDIHDTAGCLSNNSIVKIPEGLVWFGNGGIYWTDGYKVLKISKHLDLSYVVFSNSQVQGTYNPLDNTVRWTISSTANNETGANDTWLVLHLNYGIQPESVFSSMTSENNLYPTAQAFSNSLDIYNAGTPYSQLYGKVLFTDSRGYLLWFDKLALTDPKIDARIAPSAFAKKAIIWNFTTAGLDQGSPAVRKYTSDISLEIDCPTEVAVQVRHRRDDGGAWSGTGGSPSIGQQYAGSPGGGSTGNAGTPELRQDATITWGITDSAWLSDSSEHYWNSSPTLSGKRRLPAGMLRSERRQISFTNAFTVISASDSVATATVALGVSPSLATVTLDDITKRWPDDCEGYYLTFDDDTYNQTFEIAARTSDTVVTLYDPTSALTNGSKKWELKGFRKFERPRLISFTLYAESDDTTFVPGAAQTGANA